MMTLLNSVFGALALLAIPQDSFAQRIFADQARPKKREGRPESGEVNDHIVGCAARSLSLAADIGQLFRLRIHIDELDLVDDPVAARQQAFAG